ncbi:putative aminohydrolase SsnA [Cetobacterium sp.]|uniref:putative aminohydrolase SsnA n=1 Tax=Cetobacterium sp. TaxID=2071632 RepID=UPI002FC66B46
MIIGNGRVITHDFDNPYLEDGAVYISKGKIIEVGETKSLLQKYPDVEYIDAEEKLIMPGIINTHHHIYSAFARGMASTGASPQNFQEILETLWWKVDKKLNHEDIEYSALTTYIDSVKNGVTTLFDHHAGPTSIKGSLNVIAKAAKKLGIRTCLCYEVSDRDGLDKMQEGIEENIDFIKKCEEDNTNMIKGMFGLHASFTLSDESLKKCQEAMKGIDAGYHVHVAEGIGDLHDCLNKYGKRVVERLFDFDILGEKTIAVHSIHVNDFELELLKNTNTNVVHNPESNMGNAVGCAPVLETFSKGINIGLGTDGFTNDMFESLKVANILHKHNKCNPSVAWGEIPVMLFENNKKITEKYFEGKFGILKEGANADIIVVDYDPLTEINQNNYNSHLLFGVMGKNVVTTIIDGKIVMKDRKILTLDEKEVFKKSREVSKKMWNRN